jgi:hypothetical protein
VSTTFLPIKKALKKVGENQSKFARAKRHKKEKYLAKQP